MRVTLSNSSLKWMTRMWSKAHWQHIGTRGHLSLDFDYCGYGRDRAHEDIEDVPLLVVVEAQPLG